MQPLTLSALRNDIRGLLLVFILLIKFNDLFSSTRFLHTSWIYPPFKMPEFSNRYDLEQRYIKDNYQFCWKQPQNHFTPGLLDQLKQKQSNYTLSFKRFSTTSLFLIFRSYLLTSMTHKVLQFSMFGLTYLLYFSIFSYLTKMIW